jgi:hypothetical protein
MAPESPFRRPAGRERILPWLRRVWEAGNVNRLADATSPYLLQHADNPVDWWPWGEAAFEEARRSRSEAPIASIGQLEAPAGE